MKLKKNLILSGMVSAATLITSIFIPIIPCRFAPNVPNPIYAWKVCSLNPDKIKSIGHIIEYFGYSSSLTDTYIITLLTSFLITFTILHFISKKKR